MNCHSILFDVLLQKALLYIRLKLKLSLIETEAKQSIEDIILHHSHRERDKYTLPLLFGTPVAAARRQKLHKSRQYNRRENVKNKLRLFTRRPYLAPPPQQTCQVGLTVAVWNTSCSGTVPETPQVTTIQ